MISCPKCKVSLEEITYNSITIDRCPRCQGVWVDKGEAAFAAEVIQNANSASCRDCNYFGEKKHCSLLKIYVKDNFSCSHFVGKSMFR